MKRKTGWMCVALAAASAAISLTASAQTWTGTYEGDALPDSPSSNPQWQKYFLGSASALGGYLTVTTPTDSGTGDDHYLEYRLDGGGAWNPTGAGTTLEMSFQTNYTNASGWAGSALISTGLEQWSIRVGTNYVSVGPEDLYLPSIGIDSSTLHVYRFTTVGDTGNLNLYVDGGTTPAHTYSTGVASAVSRLAFGDLGSPEDGQVVWDYLRWTNAGAFAPNGSAWSLNSSGDWNKGSNWGGAVPNAADATASFPNTITSARTIFTDTPVTVGTMKFDSGNSYQIAGNGSLTIATSTGSGSISVLSGSHKINLPLVFASDTNVTVASGATLTLGNPTTINAGKTVTTSGTVLIQAPLAIQAGGTLVVGSGGASLFSAPSLDAGAAINVQSNAVSIDYSGQSDPSATIHGQLASGYAAGAWNGAGINTSSSIAGKTGLGWKDDLASKSISVKYAYYGDANLDGTVNTSDFTAMASHFNATSGVWAGGDFNYDGVVNALDFNALASNFGSVLSAPVLGSVVPEPVSISAIAMGLTMIVRRRRGR